MKSEPFQEASLSEEDRDALDTFWNELVVKLRLELGALESSGKLRNTKVTEPLPNELIATSDEGFISIWLHIETGEGSWNQIAPVDECEPWSMTASGTAVLSGKEMNLSELAHAFASKFLASAE
jgi:hypothetical protein